MSVALDPAETLITEVAPYLTASEHLADLRDLMALRVQDFVQRHRYRYEGERRSGPEVIGSVELSHLCAALSPVRRREPASAPLAFLPAQRVLEDQAAYLVRYIEARLALTEVELPLQQLAGTLGLSGEEREVLVFLLLQQDVTFRRMCQFAWPMDPGPTLTVELVASVLALEAAQEVLGSAGALRSHGLVVVSHGEDGPWHAQRVWLRPAVGAALLGQAVPLPAGLRRLERGGAPALGELVAVGRLVPELRRRMGARGAARMVVLRGARHGGRRALVRALAATSGRNVVELDLGGLSEALEVGLPRALGAAALMPAPLLVRPPKGGLDEAGWEALHAALSGARVPVYVTVGPEDALPVCLAPHILEAPSPTVEELRAMWARHLAGWPGDVEAIAYDLGRQFLLPPGLVPSVVARLARGSDPRVGVVEAITACLAPTFGPLAHPITTTFARSALVLAEDVAAGFDEIIQRVRHEAAVLDGHGYRRLWPWGAGVVCLFSGAPGTGKTMASGVLAHELGRQMYRVDLSQVVDKYLGETEKHVARLFDEAARTRAVLLFDEADGLFARRTDVKSSNDRYANLSTNFLLQRIEAYDGVCVLTTNHVQNLDDALLRRVHFHLEFEALPVDQLAVFWRTLLPASAPVAEGIAFEALAARFRDTLSPADVKRAVLRAAFRAFGEGGPMTQRHLEVAGVEEARQQGRLVMG